MMAAVAVQAESIAPYESWNDSRVRRTESDPAYTIAHNLCDAARELRLDALSSPRCRGARRAWSPPTAPPCRSTRSRPGARRSGAAV